MLHLMLSNGTHRQIPDAVTAGVEGGQVVCRNERGFIVARFDAPLVSAYGTSELLAQDFSEPATTSNAK